MKRILAAVTVCAVLTACGGGGGSSSSGSVPVVTTTPCPLGYIGIAPSCSAPTTGTTAITTSTQATQVTLPPVAGYGGTLTLPPANTNASMTLFSFAQPPSPLPVLHGRRHTTASTANAPYVYYILQANAAVTLNGTLQFSVTAPQASSPLPSYYLAALMRDSSWGTVAGPAQYAGGMLTLQASAQLQFTQAGEGVALVLYSGSPVYSGPALTISPASVALMDLNATQQVTVTPNNPNATVSIDASACAGIASVRQTAPTQFSFSAIALGTCQATASDNLGHTLPIPVSVQTTTVVVQ